MTRHFLTWRGLDSWRAEAAEVEVEGDRLTATGVQIGSAGVVPGAAEGEIDDVAVRYRLDYRLATAARFVTSSLSVRASGEGWSRGLELQRSSAGAWTCEARTEGQIGLPPPGGELDLLTGALDCDLGLSPLTNFMPVAREGLARGGEGCDFVMAWVAVPGLSVHRSEQRYEPGEANKVRYVGKHRSFVGELELDEDGFVSLYPGLAERVPG